MGFLDQSILLAHPSLGYTGVPTLLQIPVVLDPDGQLGALDSASLLDCFGPPLPTLARAVRMKQRKHRGLRDPAGRYETPGERMVQ